MTLDCDHASPWTEEEAEEICAKIDDFIRYGAASAQSYSAVVSAAANLIALCDLEVGENTTDRLDEFVRSVGINKRKILGQRRAQSGGKTFH